MKRRILAAFLLLTMLMTGVACQPGGTSDETTAGEGGTQGDTTAPGGDSLTPDWESWKPAQGAGVTELAVSGTVAGTGAGSEGTSNQELAFGPNASGFAVQGGDTEGDKVTLSGGTVSSLNLSTAFADGTIARYEAEVSLVSESLDANWCSLFIGLRLGSATDTPVTQSGVWLALRSDKIGIRVGEWAATSFVSIKASGVNFATPRKLYIEDNMQTDEITLWADNDAGERVELCRVTIADNQINLYHPGAEKPSLRDNIVDSIKPAGCFSFWLHHTKNDATINGFKATGAASEKYTAPDANRYAGRDLFTDTWVAIDEEGRISGTENGPVGDKEVGIFYFLWHDGTSTRPIYDHSAAYEKGGSALLIETMTSGPLGFAHYWAEPYFGYYQSDDEWVIRKHTAQLNAAGVDFIFIDATNGLTYEHNYETILKVWSKMRAEGQDTPQICFHCGNTPNLAEASFTALWGNLYASGRYKDLWYLHEGKPLIFMPNSFYKSLSDEQRDFFTQRQSWAFTSDAWYADTRGRGAWPWADMYPQEPGRSPKGTVEQMIVMCGFWANDVPGRSYSYKNGGQPRPDTDSDFSFSLVPKTSGLGIAFEEQFDYAIETDPGIIMITGWNEWWAGRWEAGAAIGQTVANTYQVTNKSDWTRHYFVDNFNPEYSRDIEPVKGYFNDNYYYQMVQNIRQYKGSRVPQAAFGQRPIDLAGDLSQWDIVGPEFRDYVGDTAHRDHNSYVGQLHYTNTTGRNDFTVAKVSKYEGKVVFYAECVADITAAEGTNWMNLYIDADANPETGWYGYEFLLNRSRDGSTCSIQKFVDGKWAFEDAGKAALSVRGNTIQIEVEAAALGLGATFDFKWADNSVDDGQIMQFLDLGDAAPDGRFNYRYTEEAAEPALPAVATEASVGNLVALKAGSYFALVGGKQVRLDASSTKATFFGDAEHLYLPLDFAAKTLGLSVDGLTTYNHYGVTYVDAKAAIEASGRTISSQNGLLVLADRPLTPDELTVLYRAMY